MLNVYLTNLAKYNEGYLVGKWVKLPKSEEELQADLKEVLGDDEEYFITDYESDGIKVEEYSNLEELNEKAQRIEDMTEYKQEEFSALLEVYDYDEALEKLESGNYFYLSGIDNDYDLGYYYAKELDELHDAPERLKRYFDYEAYGRDLSFGGYYTEKGFLFAH